MSGCGRFITFEGIEGCGKTTQLARLADRLERGGIEVVRTREPGGTPLGERLRELLLTVGDDPPGAETELLLYVADRAEHLRRVVEPALARDAIVLCDRFSDATLAYQGHGRGLGESAVRRLHERGPLARRPHRTVLLDLDPATGLARARARNSASAVADRFDAEHLAFHDRVRRGYLAIAEAEPERVVVVPADGEIVEVARRVDRALADLLPELTAERR